MSQVDVVMALALGEPGRPWIGVSGEVDDSRADRLRDTIVDVGTEYRRAVEVDLSEVTFIDSSGLGALVSAYRTLLTLGVPLVLRSPSRVVSRLLEITGLRTVLEVRP